MLHLSITGPQLHCTRTMCNDFASNAQAGLCSVCAEPKTLALTKACCAHAGLCNVCKVQNYMHAHTQPKGVCGMCAEFSYRVHHWKYHLIPFPDTPNRSFHRALFILFRRNQPHPYEFLPRPFEG